MLHRMNKSLFFLGAAVLVTTPALAVEWQTPQVIAAAEIAPAVATGSATTAPKFYSITRKDVTSEVARQLQLQGVEKKAIATVSAMEGNVLHSADHPLQLVLHGLQIDPSSHRWQAQANILHGKQTEVTKPISGFYEAVVSVPMLVHQVSRTDVIAATDITMRDVPGRTVRKDTVTDAQELIGKSPRAMISAERPIRSTELTMPVVIRRGELVEMSYSAPFMHIKTTGIAMDDGELGGMLRVKNSKTEKSVSTRVVGAGKVEANLGSNS